MNTLLSTGTTGAKQYSPARKRSENVLEKLQSAVGTAFTRELFHFSVPTPRSVSTPTRSGRLHISVSLSSLNLSWSTN